MKDNRIRLQKFLGASFADGQSGRGVDLIAVHDTVQDLGKVFIGSEFFGNDDHQDLRQAEFSRNGPLEHIDGFLKAVSLGGIKQR